MSARGFVVALTCFCLAAGLSACGSGTSPGSTSSSTPSRATAPAASAGTQGKSKSSAAVPGAAAARAGKGSAAQGSAAGFSEGTAGASSGDSTAKKKGAAGFVVAGGDNSIPAYGSESSSQEKADAAEALTAYLKARAVADWGSACSFLGAPVRSQVEILAAAAGGEKSKSCPAALAKIAEKAPEEERENPFSGRLAAFRAKGEHAFALFYGPHQQKYMMPMVSEGGGWKMGMFAPVPYPPGGAGGG